MYNENVWWYVSRREVCYYRLTSSSTLWLRCCSDVFAGVVKQSSVHRGWSHTNRYLPGGSRWVLYNPGCVCLCVLPHVNECQILHCSLDDPIQLKSKKNRLAVTFTHISCQISPHKRKKPHQSYDVSLFVIKNNIMIVEMHQCRHKHLGISMISTFLLTWMLM